MQTPSEPLGKGHPMAQLDDVKLKQIEKQHASGLTSVEILDLFATHGVRLSEATLRKYVQLGLLPRSVRVGQKGKHQGSKGVYPVSVVRQILQIKRMMAESYTIEQIQREIFFMRSELEELEQTLNRIFKKIDGVVTEKRREQVVRVVSREVGDARALSKELLSRLASIEARLTSQAKVGRVAAS
jgi:DNA-binding transcriptional MerR regulator